MDTILGIIFAIVLGIIVVELFGYILDFIMDHPVLAFIIVLIIIDHFW